jgi:hypothetical protein
MFSLTLLSHSHVYILERSQHKVPEEALKVSGNFHTLNMSDSQVEASSYPTFLLCVLAWEVHQPAADEYEGTGGQEEGEGAATC